MTDVALDFDHVSKKFRKGELHDSLRDFVPAVVGGLLRRNGRGALGPHEFWALDDVSFQVRRGEAFGIIGANGAGKSTVLKLASGIMRPTRGQVRVNGSVSALIEVSAGFHPDLTGRENIYLNGTILGMRRAAIRAKFDEIVAFSGLEEFLDTPVKRYSSGMFARLGFAVAAHVDRDILIVDEVLSVGDYAFQRKCLERMDAVIASGTTVVFVSHNLRALADLCTRSTLLKRGRVATTGATADVVAQYLRQEDSDLRHTEGKDIFVSRVGVRDAAGEHLHFASGQTAWIDVELTARASRDRLAVALELHDENNYKVFATSTEMLGHAPFALAAGDRWRCAFEIALHLAPGTFHFGVAVDRLHAGVDYWYPAATIHVSGERAARGIVNLYPRVAAEAPAHGVNAPA